MRNLKKEKQKLLEQLKKVPIIQVACERAGIPRSTFYRWRKDDTEFLSDCEVALEQSSAIINDMAESQLINAIKNQNMTAIIFWLKHHHKAYETRIAVKGKLKFEQKTLTAEQEELIKQALQMLRLGKTSEGENNG
jgi:hypothetical protein